jgi:Tfp pilus assembly protein PilO
MDIRQLIRNGRLWLHVLVVLAAVSLSGALISDLSVRKAELARQIREVDAKEAQAAATPSPTLEEQREWASQEEILSNTLTGDESLPLLFAEITRIGGESGVQGIGITTEERAVAEGADTTSPAAGPIDAALLAANVSRYSAVTIRFQGGYAGVARFLDAISRLPYAVSIRSADLRRAVPLIDGTLLLHVYKRGAA